MRGRTRPPDRPVRPPNPDAELDDTEDADDAVDFGHFDDEHDDNATPRVTAEDAYADALRDENEHDTDADGSLTRAAPEQRRWLP